MNNKAMPLIVLFVGTVFALIALKNAGLAGKTILTLSLAFIFFFNKGKYQIFWKVGSVVAFISFLFNAYQLGMQVSTGTFPALTMVSGISIAYLLALFIVIVYSAKVEGKL